MRIFIHNGEVYRDVVEPGNRSCFGCAFDIWGKIKNSNQFSTGCRLLDEDVKLPGCNTEGNEQRIWIKKES